MILKPYYKMIPPLNGEEVFALSGYKDMSCPQDIWHINFPKDKKVGDNCFAINEYLRGRLALTVGDAILASYKAGLISSAISKCKSNHPIRLWRGYSNPTKILKMKKGDEFVEKAFVSSTINKNIAIDYALKKGAELPVISVCKYPTNTPMIYFDEDEEEFLLAPHKYRIVSVKNKHINKKLFKVYTVKMVK